MLVYQRVDKAIKDPWIQQKPMFRQQDPMAMSLFLKKSWIEEANVGLRSCQRNKQVFLRVLLAASTSFCYY